jgi:UDP-galactopyranose mutase
MSYDALVVGAGLAGSVVAERLASQQGARVLVVDRRPHVAGNAYDELDANGIRVHRYGPHIFHTNAQAVVDYLSTFTSWHPYEHRVLASVRGNLVPIPINRTTLNVLFDAGLRDEAAAAAFLEARAEPIASPRTSEEVVVAKVGRELYELFFRGYTRKQWGLDPSQLDASVAARIPTRVDTDDRYFTDRFQAMPADGFTAMVERMLDHPRIEVRTGVDFATVRDSVDRASTIYTGPIDAYYGQRFGALPYRSLRFEFETLPVEWSQPVGTINYPDESAVPYTRITEFKHLTGQEAAHTTIVREYPTAKGDPYYPIPRPANAERYQRYEALARAESNVHFLGRLGTYKYYNMDQVVAQALTFARRFQDGTLEAA